MKLSEVFSQLAYGELSQLALADIDTGLILPAKQGQVVAHMNLGLTALYTRFHLKENRLKVKLVPGQANYPLTEDAGVIPLLDEEFLGDVLKIQQVFTDTQEELGLNNAADPHSCFTPSPSVLRVPLLLANKGPDLPEHLLTDTLEVVYRAAHFPLVYKGSGFNPSRIELELPTTHLEPLLLYVASRAHNPIGMTNEFHAGNSWYAKYEAACARLEHVGMAVDQGSQNTRAGRGGWV